MERYRTERTKTNGRKMAEIKNRKYIIALLQHNKNICPHLNFNDKEIDSFYEDVSTAIDRNTTHHYIINRDFIAKVVKKGDGDISVGIFGMKRKRSTASQCRRKLKLINYKYILQKERRDKMDKNRP